MNETEITTGMIILAVVFLGCILAACLTMIPGFILSALGKDKIGSKLIRFGAGCGVIAFSSAIVVRGGYWPIAMLVAAVFWIILQRKRRSKTNACPRCHERITWEEKRKLVKLFGLRGSAICPHCGTKFVLSKWPWRVMNIGSCLCIIFILLKLSKVEFGNLSDVAIYVILLPMIIGTFTMKLEISDSEADR